MRIIISTIYQTVILSFFVVFVVDGIAQNRNLDQQEKALQIIADFAERFCTTIPLEGEGETIELSGEAKVELNNLIKKIADLGIRGAVKYQRSEWKGLLQKDLAGLLRDSINCRLEVWKDLQDKLIVSARPPDQPGENKKVPPGQKISTDNIDLTLWTVDPTGVCRDDNGYHPRWTAYKWTLERCKAACKGNPNCQGFAMSKTENYCQLMGSDGSRPASKPGTRITRGDSSQPMYTCYLKR